MDGVIATSEGSAAATMDVTRISDRFGGMSAFSRALGHNNPTTVQKWLKNGIIPPGYHLRVLDAAAAAGLKLRREWFNAYPDDHIAFESDADREPKAA